MIVLDIESSGIDTGRCGIWQIGALELENPRNSFFQEGKIDEEDIIEESALRVIGKTEENLRDLDKQFQKELILNFLDWTKRCKEKLFLGQNIGWDLNFIQNKCLKYGIMNKFRETVGQRGIDLHTLAQQKYYEVYKKYFLKEKGSSNMNTTTILNFCGIPDKRIKIKEGSKQGGVEKDGNPHNAREDCRLEGEAYYRLTYGKTHFPEYSQFKIPTYLIK